MKKRPLSIIAFFMIGISAHSQTNTFPSSGNVGVGTTSPAGKMQVVGNSGWDTYTKFHLTNGATDFGRTNLILTGRIQGLNDGWYFGSDGRNSIVFSSNNASSGQNIGAVGTEQFSLQHEMASNSLGFLSQTKGSSPIFVMKQSGRVGLGVTDPVSVLDVQAEVGTSAFRIQGGFPYGTYYLDAASYLKSGSGVGYSFSLKNGGGQFANVLSLFNNKVGLGTADPRAFFDVAHFIDNATLGSVLGRLQEGNSTGAGTYLGVRGFSTQSEYNGKSFSLEHSFYGTVNSSINFYRGGGITGGYLTFNTDADTERMRITTDGNVAIGATDPRGYKLAVAGKIVAEEVVVKLQGSWPDYVFENDYPLSSLTDIEKYIQTNKHLPGVPAQAEVAANGLSIGEMNAILLKKVEELTLHLIEMKNENDSIKREVTALRNDLSKVEKHSGRK